MTYSTFEIGAAVKGTCEFFNIVAIDIDAAIADLKEVYSEIRIITWRRK